MITKKTFRYRLRPKRKQLSLFAQGCGACRWVYNRALAERKRVWEEEQRSIRLYDQHHDLALLKSMPETAWLKEVHSQILQQALHDLDDAYQYFFRRIKNKETPGYPKFRRKGEHDSFRYPQGVKVKEDFVYLPKIGWVRFRKSREIEGVIKQTTVKCEAGHWYVIFSCEVEIPTPKIIEETPRCVGVDLGLKSFAVFAGEEGIKEVGNPRFLKKGLSRLRYLSRQLSKKIKCSKNRSRAKRALSHCHRSIRNKRNDFLQKLSTKLVKSHDKIVVESLNVKKLLMSSSVSMARSISDVGWRQFLQMVKYKCEHLGKILVEVGQFFPSSQLCSSCGRRHPMALSDRTYNCQCGLSMDRDHNAALVLRAAGASVQSLRSCPQ